MVRHRGGHIDERRNGELLYVFVRWRELGADPPGNYILLRTAEFSVYGFDAIAILAKHERFAGRKRGH